MSKNNITLPYTLMVGIMVCCMVTAADKGGERRIARTVHNLSTRVTNPQGARGEVCRYCHTPHHGRGMNSLWGRSDSKAIYKIYESSTLDANPGQPNSNSKMCLSCHDGTLALSGNTGKGIGAGLMNLGTDLSNDHPISFVYDATLASKDPQLKMPSLLPAELKLDKNSQLQCTTCHDVHNNTFGNFLAVEDRDGKICTSCHQMSDWETSAHRNSTAQVKHLSSSLPYATVGQNACRNCHRPHNALGNERLQIHEEEEKQCLECHSGAVAKTNIASEIRKTSAHDPTKYVGLHDPTERGYGKSPHIECADCHNPHSVAPQSSQTAADRISLALRNVKGVSILGNDVKTATAEYEICLRCHGDKSVQVNGITRVVSSSNIREEVSRTAASYHPISTGLTTTETVSLKNTVTRGTTITCTDCHNNDQGPGAGGTGPRGPHGSRFAHLLERNYEMTETVAESEQAYALCYKCHDRQSILADESFPHHKKHIVDKQTPCSTCHDPHGVIDKAGTSQAHLINFNTLVVTPSTSGVIEFRDDSLSPRKGSCALSCHGKNHEHATEGY